jgi:hypothetical protein
MKQPADHTGVIMIRTNHHPLARFAALGIAVVGLVVVSAGRASAQHPRSDTGTGPGRGDARTIPAPAQPVSDHTDWTLQWVLLTAAVLAGLAVVAAVTAALDRRRWRQPPLEAALGSVDPDELPRAAGLLADRLAQQDRARAAEHAYRAAIDADDPYWSPLAQVALADLLRNRGQHTEAQALLEAVIASGHPRAVPAAHTSLHQLRTGKGHAAAASTVPRAYETLG